jgi:hypothetical protein
VLTATVQSGQKASPFSFVGWRFKSSLVKKKKISKRSLFARDLLALPTGLDGITVDFGRRHWILLSFDIAINKKRNGVIT